ncbi:hypothetical protein, partial [Streptomyces spectabilis]|uniref:hypothetical protein n=1 Tax=Streptomyces spectabilis TaxID=68270 RepID=UPI0033C2F18D
HAARILHEPSPVRGLWPMPGRVAGLIVAVVLPCLQTLVEQEGQHSPALMHGGSGDERMLPQAVFNESAVHLLQPHIPRNRVC